MKSSFAGPDYGDRLVSFRVDSRVLVLSPEFEFLLHATNLLIIVFPFLRDPPNTVDPIPP